MRLINVRGRPRNAGSSRSGVDLLERDLPPLPAHAEAAREDMGAATADAELAEFVEFFTGEQRAVTSSDVQTAVAPQPAIAPQPTRRAKAGQPGRMRRATERVIGVAAIRPVVHIPVPSRRVDVGAVTAGPGKDAPARRAIKLPPLWMLANLAIVATMLFAFAPQIMTASAAAGCKWYQVRPGDTLTRISHRYGVSVSSIASANDIENINLIYVDQQMCIPLMPLAHSNQPAPASEAHAPIYSAPSNVRTFINYTLPYAREASSRTGWPVSVILAQWGLETGWRTQTYTGYNWGNCGAMPGQPMIGGINKPGSPAAFAYANTPEQGLAEYVHVAGLGYYAHVATAAQGGADAAARELGRSPWDWGHYTNRGDPGSSLINIMRVYNLYWYDTH